MPVVSLENAPNDTSKIWAPLAIVEIWVVPVKANHISISSIAIVMVMLFFAVKSPFHNLSLNITNGINLVELVIHSSI